MGRKEIIPTMEELERHARDVPEIKPAEVISMLRLKQAAADIQRSVMDVLAKKHRLSEGKFRVLVLLHQRGEGTSPSLLAERCGVTRPTISAMLQRLEREGMVRVSSSSDDGRGKMVHLTAAGRSFLDEILPSHYERITKLMGRLTESEQQELGRLLNKLLENNTEKEKSS